MKIRQKDNYCLDT